MEDTSSSSDDEETKQRILSAVWNVNQPYKPPKDNEGKKQPGISTLPKSLRVSKAEPEFSEDYGGIKASPELKSFVAKKLISYLDGTIAEYTSDMHSVQDTKSDDDFRLFSTSKKHDSCIVLPDKRKVLLESSSDSDSDEERQRLASVAVSFEDVIHSQRILSAVTQDKPAQQVTSDLSPMTSSNSKGCREIESQQNYLKDPVNGNDLEEISNGRKKKKKKKREEKVHPMHLKQSSSPHSETQLCSDGQATSAVDCNGRLETNSPRRHKSKSLHGERHTPSTAHQSHCKQSVPDNATKICADSWSRARKKKHKLTRHNSLHTDTRPCDDGDDNIDENHVQKSKKRKKHKKDMPLQ